MGNVAIELTAVDRGAGRSLDQLTQRLGTVNVRTEEARRETLQYRDAVNKINAEIADNNKLLLTADQATQQSLRTKNRALSVERQLLNVQSARSRQQVALLNQESRETRGLIRNLEGATRGTGLLSRATAGFGTVLAGVGIAVAAREVFRLGANSVEASVKVEGFRNSLTALYGDAQIANSVLADLQELSLLPGITFESAVQGAVRLKTVSVEGDRALGVVREFGNAAALAGASTDAVGRSLVGFTQILSRGKVSQEELNQILENVPLIGNSIREAFGSIDAEVIRDQLDAAGQGVQDFADILVNQLSMGARASADSTRNAFSNLENATFRLHAAIGDRLSPSVREATGFLTDLANTAADFVAGTNDATRSANSYADALMMASNAAAVNSAIQERIKFLEQERAGLEAAAAGSANYFEIRGRERDAGRQYREAGEELDVLRTALGNTAAATEHFQGVQNELLETQQGITQEIIRLEAQRAGETARAYGQTTQDIREQREALAETQEQIGENAVVLRALASAHTTATAATDESTAATEESTAAAKEATVEIITYAEAIRQVQANIEAYVEEQALLTDFGTFWEIAAGQADGYSTAIDLTTASVVNLKNELDALTTLFNENNVVINENGVVLDEETQALLRFLATLDGLDESLANVERRLDAHNAALVNPAVSEAVESFRDYNDVLSETGVNFERVDSISNRLTSSIRDQASAFDELARSAGRAATAQQGIPRNLQNQLPGQVIGSGVFDDFNAQTPGFTQGRGYYEPRITGGDNTFRNNLIALGNNLETFTEDFSVNIGDIVSAVEGGISPLDAFERSLIQLDPAFGVLTTTVRLLVEEIGEAERRREEFRRTRDLTETQRGTFGRGRLTGLGSDTEFPGSSGRFQTQIGSALSSVQGTAEEAILSGLLNQISEAGADRPLAANLEALELAYQPFIDGLRIGMEAAGESLQYAIDQGFDETVISGRVEELVDANTNFYDTQIREVRAAANLSGNDPRNAVFALVRERDEIINQATNQLRGLSRGLPNNVILQNNIRRGQALAERTGTDQDFTEGIARQQYGDEAYDAEVAAAGSPAEALQTQIANRVANEALDAIREAASDVNATTASIVEAWEAARPEVEAWYQELLDDANAIEDEAERNEAIAALGTLPEFVANLKSQYVTPVLSGIARATEALETRTANRLAQDALGAISEAAGDVNATEQEILDQWTAAIPALENWWQELYEDIINNPNLSDAQQTEDLAALGSQQDFVASLKSQYVTPVIAGIRQATEALQTRTANRLAQDALGAISEAASDANVTEAEIVNLWDASIPALETWYQELLDDANAIENDTERAEALAALGTPEAFIANLKAQYVTPVITGIQRSAEALETRTANRLAQEALGALREAASDVNITEAEIAALWATALPLIETWYQELLDDANAIENDADRGEALAALGTPEQFVATLKTQYVTPVITGIRRSAEALETRTANRLAQKALGGLRELGSDANITEQAIAEAWTAALPLINNWYQELLDDANAIENEGLRNEALAALGSPEAFVANLKAQYVTPVITGLQRSQEARETRTANRLAQNALKGLREIGSDVNVTEQVITDAWIAALPFIETWYQELLDDANAIENDADRGEALDALGSPEAFIANLKSQYVTPVLTGIAQSTEALETRTANRQAQGAIGALRTVADDVNVTEQAIIDKWQEAIPFIETWWQELYDDIVNNENLSDAQIRESLAELGSAEDFIGNIRSQYVTPVLNNILGTQFQNRSNAAQNRLNTARFNLGDATSESDFETRRDLLIGAINAYYDAEEERINNLEVSEEMLRDLREDNQLARDQAIRRATDTTNTFEEERLEMVRETQEAIDDLHEDALDAATNRLSSLEDAHQRHLQRVLGLELGFSRDLEDLRRDRIDDAEDLNLEYQRDLEDLQNRFTRQLVSDAIAFADLTAEQQQRVTESTGFQQGLFDLNVDRNRDRQDLGTELGGLRPGSGGYQFYRSQLESGELTDQNLIERLFGRQGLGDFIDLTRGTEDAESALEQGILDANQEAVRELIDINTSLGNIGESLQSLSLTDTFENIRERIEMGLKPFLESITELLDPIEQTVSTVRDLGEPLQPPEMMPLGLGAQMMMPPDLEGQLMPLLAATPPEMLVESVSIQANSVSVNGEVVGEGSPTGAQPNGNRTQPEATENITVIVQLDDGTLTQVEGRLATRADQGLSPLKV